jgi:hypothetical protein
MAQTKREYLVDKGLAKPGRGRFSREALAALAHAETEGVTFTEGAPKTVKAEEEAGEQSPAPLPRPVLAPEKRMRKEKVAWATITLESSGRSLPVQLGYCGKCQSRVVFCHCSKGPRVPSWIDQSLPPASLTHPKGI